MQIFLDLIKEIQKFNKYVTFATAIIWYCLSEVASYRVKSALLPAIATLDLWNDTLSTQLSCLISAVTDGLLDSLGS